MELNLIADWKLFNLRQADAVGTPLCTLLVYSDVVRSNIVADTEHLLDVGYRRDGLGAVQWIPYVVRGVGPW